MAGGADWNVQLSSREGQLSFVAGVNLHHPTSLLEFEVVHRLSLNVEADEVIFPAETTLLYSDHIRARQLVGKAEPSLLRHLSHLLAKALRLQCHCQSWTGVLTLKFK